MFKGLLVKFQNAIGSRPFMLMPYNFHGAQELATYNSEVSRGLMHTEEFKVRMALAQERFNEGLKEHCRKNNIMIIGE